MRRLYCERKRPGFSWTILKLLEILSSPSLSLPAIPTNLSLCMLACCFAIPTRLFFLFPLSLFLCLCLVRRQNVVRWRRWLFYEFSRRMCTYMYPYWFSQNNDYAFLIKYFHCHLTFTNKTTRPEIQGDIVNSISTSFSVYVNYLTNKKRFPFPEKFATPNWSTLYSLWTRFARNNI